MRQTTVQGGPGDDFLAGLFGNDVLEGGPGDDFMNGDIFEEFSDEPALDPMPNEDSCIGGPDHDASIFCESNSNVEADLTPAP